MGLIIALVVFWAGDTTFPDARMVARADSMPPDEAIFRTVVASFAEDALREGASIQVDPRPITALGHESIRPGSLVAAVSGDFAEHRSAQLRDLGIETGNIADRPLCAGILVPPSFRPPNEACPAEAVEIVAIGLPRWDDSGIPGLAGTDWKNGLDGTVAVVFVHARYEGPGGSKDVSDAVVLANTGEIWVLVRRIGLSIAH